MAAPIAFPGRYTPEIPNGPHVIHGVPTSVAAFMGRTATGPVNDAHKIRSFADFEQLFGGFHPDSDLSYAVGHFFQNGGHTAWVVRVEDTGCEGAAGDHIGDRAAGTGIFALEEVQDVNIIALPGHTDSADLARVIAYAEERRAMVILDMDAGVDTPEKAQDWLGANAALISPNAAAYFPRLRMADLLLNGRPRSFPNSGAMAGLWARTDSSRGVWKAPAGTESAVRGAQSLDYMLSDLQNGMLNPRGLNSIRAFPGYGIVSWGARTMAGADTSGNEWKYIPVRRLALFIEESVTRGTDFAVFQPNDAPLWSNIRLAVSNFMHDLFRQGAFQGRAVQDAYVVRCDASTTTRADIERGKVVIQVGFAPLKPAEFVVITIRQNAGSSAN